ncbi:HEL263Wp [Eremothecium sinecaudum]|uniref:HEL263Wp n=1 Tax=Eremothecium sinecaudum TaxID=45286 RepID=A0A109UZY1_9SACH|nr:HEL263Wp [Eremothecium sinecaudum]AMD21018.1 HEL263Wp [Eremothecium sinecaudum]
MQKDLEMQEVDLHAEEQRQSYTEPYPIREVYRESPVVHSHVTPNLGRRQGSSSGQSSYDDDHLPDEDDMVPVPLMVKPKEIYQNPQTPTVLPSHNRPVNKWMHYKETYFKEFLAEFLGTMVLVFFGDASIVQVRSAAQARVTAFQSSLDANANAGIAGLMSSLVTPYPAGDVLSICLCWAGAVALGFYAAGGASISGGHINPAVTLANYIFRGLPGKKVPIYIAGQMLGGYVGGLLVFWYYGSVIQTTYPDWFENEAVVGMFSCVPLSYLSSGRQFISEVVIAAILIGSLFSMTDPYTSVSPEVFPFMLFILIFCLMAATTYQTGAALNPARDIGPRLAMWTVGFDTDVLWRSHNHFFWVVMTAPFIGGIIGGLVYDTFIFQGHESPVNQPVSKWSAKAKSILMPFSSKRTKAPSRGATGTISSTSEKELQMSDSITKSGVYFQQSAVNQSGEHEVAQGNTATNSGNKKLDKL